MRCPESVLRPCFAAAQARLGALGSARVRSVRYHGWYHESVVDRSAQVGVLLLDRVRTKRSAGRLPGTGAETRRLWALKGLGWQMGTDAQSVQRALAASDYDVVAGGAPLAES